MNHRQKLAMGVVFLIFGAILPFLPLIDPENPPMHMGRSLSTSQLVTSSMVFGIPTAAFGAWRIWKSLRERQTK